MSDCLLKARGHTCREKKGKIYFTHFALDVVEGEHAVGVAAFSLDSRSTLARAGRAESGTHDTNWSSEAGRRSRRDAVSIPWIHD